MPKTLLLADDSVVIQKLVGLSFANEDVDLVTAEEHRTVTQHAGLQFLTVVLAPAHESFDVRSPRSRTNDER